MLQSTIKNSPLTIKIIQNKQMLAKKKYLTCKFFIYCSKLNLRLNQGTITLEKKETNKNIKLLRKLKT